MPDRHLDQRDEGIKIFDLDLEEQAKNLLHAKCVMVPDKLTTRCPHFSVGPARTGTPCLGKLAGALGGSPMARHPDPPRSSRNIIHKHFPELRPCKVEAFTSNDFQPTCGTIHDALTDTRAMAWVSVP
ncbi:hypothetical protein Lal_00048562 [Lupinus albus]|nr:hypothetical protein Lal_00048562 [Lupinus albus]